VAGCALSTCFAGHAGETAILKLTFHLAHSVYRVSTGKQGKSGLGIEAQRQAVANYLNGGNWRIVGEFVEVESGRRSDRPELDKALAAARVRQVPLLVAKVDRLSIAVA
jgi:DNA invertase Pin-like site-specific DNA recombinase